jgi:predicted DNA-binding transcriptional regulator YafY
METRFTSHWLVRNLQQAIEKEYPVTITYRKLDGSITVRTIEPYRMKISRMGAPLLLALDRDSGAPRSFRISQIRIVTMHTRGHRTLDHYLYPDER